MKLRTKDEIISCLIDSLSVPVGDYNVHESYIHDGWIEALKWVLGLSEEEKKVFKYSKKDIKWAVDIAVGDDGHRSKEVIEILEGERNEIDTTS
jgi:hypothetical protein